MMTGCWHKSVCTGNASYLMFDGRKIQWFCGPEALVKINSVFGAMKFPLKAALAKHWTKAENACLSHADCFKRSSNAK